MATTLLLLLIPAAYLLTGPLTRFLLGKKRYAWLPRPGRLSVLMRRTLALQGEHAGAAALRVHIRPLTEAAAALRREQRVPARLPSAPHEAPRAMLLAQSLLDEGNLRAAALTASLRQAADRLTLRERELLPRCLHLQLALELADTLEQIITDHASCLQGRRLAKRMLRSRQPQKLLERKPLPLETMHALLTCLREKQAAPLLAMIDGHLAALNSSPAAVARLHAQREGALADAVIRISSQFKAVNVIDWPRLLENTDPLHTLLLSDAVYAAMDAPSRALYRRKAAGLSRLFRRSEQEVIQAALSLSRKAHPDALESHVGWYLLEDAGREELRRAMGNRWSRPVLFLQRRRFLLFRLSLLAAGCAASLFFLYRGYTLWLLPAFLLPAGCLYQPALKTLFRASSSSLPRMELSSLGQDTRVLVVLPASLTDRHSAVRAARQLLTARRSLLGTGVDCLLMGDWGHAMTQRSGDDPGIISAASASIGELNAHSDDGTRYFYLQRSRTWDPAHHAYAARKGRSGALEAVCRLMADGSCTDPLDAATFRPEELHHRYAWMLVIDRHVRLEPDAVLRLAGTLLHPLHVRLHTRRGVRGYAMLRSRMHPLTRENSTLLQSLLRKSPASPAPVLISPAALLEDTEGWQMPDAAAPLLWPALAGCAVGDANAYHPVPATLDELLLAEHSESLGSWSALPWQFSHVRAENGIHRNPLKSRDRFLLRASLRRSLLPAAQAVLLLAAVWARDAWMGLFALLAPALLRSSRPLAALGKVVLTPTRAWLQLDAFFRAVRAYLLPERAQQPLTPDRLTSAEWWCQTIYAAMLVSLSVMKQPWSLSGMLFAAAMVFFPLLHARLDHFPRSRKTLSAQDASLVQDMASGTWRYFEDVLADDSALPPDLRQQQPAPREGETSSVRTIALSLLAVVAAREAGLTDAPSAAGAIRRLTGLMEKLPVWHGLFFHHYNRFNLSDESRSIPAADNGLMCACLMTAAQSLRCCLEEIDESDFTLPARLDSLAARMELDRLYDPDAGLFLSHFLPDQAEQDADHLRLFADEGLLLSFVAIMRRQVPPEHLSRLIRHRIRLRGLQPMLTFSGGAEAFLPSLLLPALHGTPLGEAVRSAARLQLRHGHEQLFGLGQSACNDLDEHLHFITHTFGTPEAAEHQPLAEPVYASWACALFLPFIPEEASESLRQMRSMGLSGPLGLHEAIDLTRTRLPEKSGYALVRMHDTSHQAVILCAACNALTDQALSRRFLSLPAADAAALLLQAPSSSLLLPRSRCFPPEEAPREPSFVRNARSFCSPLDAHLIGSGKASLLMGAHGSGVIRLGGEDVTRFSARAEEVEGLQLYLRAEGRVIRLFDPTLPGEVFFGEGSIQFIRHVDSLLFTITLLIDPAAGAVLHILEIENTQAQENVFELADCLLPAFDAPAELLADHAAALSTDNRRLVHSFHTDQPPLEAHVMTDSMLFLGGNRNLHHPASLQAEPPRDVTDASVNTCLSFRLRMHLSGQSKRTVTFATYWQKAEEPLYQPGDLPTQLTLARLSARTLADSLPAAQSQISDFSMLTGALMWQGQMHQGTSAALPASISAYAPQLPQPMLLVLLYTQEGVTLLQEAAAAAGWIMLGGRSVSLYVCCCGDEAEQTAQAAEACLSGALLRRHASGQVFIRKQPDESELYALQASARLMLTEGHGTAAEQIIHLIQPLPALPAALPSSADEHSEPDWHFGNQASGFDPSTGDLLMHLRPGEALPASWHCRLHSSRYLTQAVYSGLHQSSVRQAITQSERIFLQSEDDQWLCSVTPEPLGHTLPWDIRFSPDLCTWETSLPKLSLTFRAAGMPRQSCGVRSLRLRNHADRERHLTVHIAVDFVLGNRPEEILLTGVDGGATAIHPAMDGAGFVMLSEGSPILRICTPLGFQGWTDVPCMQTSGSNGSVAVLSVPVTIAAGGSAAVSYLIGYAARSDELELMLRRLRRSGASGVFRSVRQKWAQQIDGMSFVTPEESLSLLLNRWLPHQFLYDHQLPALAGCMLLSPDAVRPQLLLSARDNETDPLLPWAVARYVRISGNEGALNDLVPHVSGHQENARNTLYACCLSIFRTEYAHRTDRLRQLLSLRAFLPLMDRPDWEELSPLLDEAAARETLEPASDVMTAALMVLALDDSTEAIASLRRMWHQCFDPMYGLLQLDASPASPQDTLSAVWMLLALAELGWADQAWTLLRALNPIHHTDDPIRLAEYRQSPHLLTQTIMHAAPHAGQAGSTPSPAAAGLLYAAVVEKLLGIRRCGDKLHLDPLLPEEWTSFTVNLRVGSATWHICLGDFNETTIDGETAPAVIDLTDDGRVHQVNRPIRQSPRVPAPAN